MIASDSYLGINSVPLDNGESHQTLMIRALLGTRLESLQAYNPLDALDSSNSPDPPFKV